MKGGFLSVVNVQARNGKVELWDYSLRIVHCMLLCFAFFKFFFFWKFTEILHTEMKILYYRNAGVYTILYTVNFSKEKLCPPAAKNVKIIQVVKWIKERRKKRFILDWDFTIHFQLRVLLTTGNLYN